MRRLRILRGVWWVIGSRRVLVGGRRMGFCRSWLSSCLWRGLISIRRWCRVSRIYMRRRRMKGWIERVVKMRNFNRNLEGICLLFLFIRWRKRTRKRWRRRSLKRWWKSIGRNRVERIWVFRNSWASMWWMRGWRIDWMGNWFILWINRIMRMLIRKISSNNIQLRKRAIVCRK